MSLTRSFTALSLISAVVAGAIGSTVNEATVLKRSPLLENRQTCSIAGWIPACPVGIPCVPVGAICCDDGTHYALPPFTCPEGTHPIATATLSAPSTPTITPTPTLPPVPVLTSYTFTITWYYYYYYYYYVAAETILTSSTITTETTVLVSATDSAAATASFKALSATIALATPTQDSTSVSGAPAATTTAQPSTTVTPIYTVSPSTNATVPAPTYSQVPIGAAMGVRADNGLAMTVFAVAALTPALLMVWL